MTPDGAARHQIVKIDVKRPVRVELHIVPDCTSDAEANQAGGYRLRYAVCALFVVAIVYLLATSSFLVLCIVGGAFAAVLALAAAVCIYAQNNTPM